MKAHSYKTVCDPSALLPFRHQSQFHINCLYIAPLNRSCTIHWFRFGLVKKRPSGRSSILIITISYQSNAASVYTVTQGKKCWGIRSVDVLEPWFPICLYSYIYNTSWAHTSHSGLDVGRVDILKMGMGGLKWSIASVGMGKSRRQSIVNAPDWWGHGWGDEGVGVKTAYRCIIGKSFGPVQGKRKLHQCPRMLSSMAGNPSDITQILDNVYKFKLCNPLETH